MILRFGGPAPEPSRGAEIRVAGAKSSCPGLRVPTDRGTKPLPRPHPAGDRGQGAERRLNTAVPSILAAAWKTASGVRSRMQRWCVSGQTGTLAGAAGDAVLEVDGPRVVRPRPGDVRRTEEAQHRHVERRGEVPGAGIRRHQQRGPADARLREPEAQRLVRQADDPRMTGLGHDLPRRIPLARPADHQDGHPRLVGQPARERGEVPGGPRLGRAEGPARVQADYGAIPDEPQPGPCRVGRTLVGGGRIQLSPQRVDRAAQVPGKFEVILDGRRRGELTLLVAGRGQPIRQQPAARISVVADAPPRTAESREPRGSERVRQQDGQVESPGPEPPDQRERPLISVLRPRCERDQLIEPRPAVQRRRNVRLDDSDHLRPRESPPERAEGRRRHPPCRRSGSGRRRRYAWDGVGSRQ